MSIHDSRQGYFHDTPKKVDVVEGQETVEEWQARTGKTPELVGNTVTKYKTELMKDYERRGKK